MDTAVPELAIIREQGVMETLMERRGALGLDKRDEVWEGVLHVVPPASEGHSGSQTALGAFLFLIAERRGGRMRGNLSVREPGTGERSYRVPDLVYLAPDDLPKLGEVYCDGGPAVVFEVLSPRDESYEKLAFYARIGAREVVVVDPGARRAEVYRLAGTQYVAVDADPSGRIPIEAISVRFERRQVGDEAKLFLLDDTTGAEQRIA
jgi:Uma2 family endonuclease